MISIDNCTITSREGKPYIKLVQREDSELFVVVRFPYYLMCKGDATAAALLSMLEGSIQSRINTAYREHKTFTDQDCWVSMSYSYITQRILNFASKNTVIKSLKWLVTAGYILVDESRETFRYSLNHELVLKHYTVANDLIRPLRENGQEFPIDAMIEALPSLLCGLEFYFNRNSTETVTVSNLVGSVPKLVRLEALSVSNLVRRRSSLEGAVEGESRDEPRPDQIQALTESGTVIDKQTSSYEDTYTPTATAFGVTLKEDFLIDCTTQKESIITANELDNTNKIKEKTEKMTETEIVLKRYEQSPKQFKNQWFRNKKLVKLNQDFGDKMDAVIEEYGYDAALGAMEAFLVDEYWKENGQPLPAFFKQIDRWMGEDQSALAAPRTNSQPVRNDETPPIAPRGCNEQEYYNGITPEQKKKAEMSQRRDEALRIMKMTEHPDYDEAYAICCRGFDHLTAPMIESWMTKGIERYNETHEWPLTIVSRPLI